MIATDTFTVNITENDEDSGLGLILYVFNLVGMSGESLTKQVPKICQKNNQTYFEGGASFKQLRSDITWQTTAEVI
jgi:hypothetical protein